MPKWFYKDTDREVGPLEASELRQLAGSGKLLPSDAVRREDMQNWTPANRIKGLFGTDSAPSVPPPLESSGAVGATPEPLNPSVPAEQVGGIGSRIMATMKKAAVLAAKHAQLKTPGHTQLNSWSVQ